MLFLDMIIKAKAVVETFLFDLEIQIKEENTKAAYRLGPPENGNSRPGTIKPLLYASAHLGAYY